MSDLTHSPTARYRRLLGVVALANILFVALIGALTAPGAVRAAITPPFTADFTATGELPGDDFGFDVAAAGDVSDDGRDDLLVGAPFARKAYVYLGGASGLTHTNVITLTSPTTDTNDQYGYSVAGDGDTNGDGVADFLVGALTGNISGTDDVGLVYVYTGSAVSPTLAVTLTGELADDNFGRAAAIIAGSTSDDLFDDVAVGAWKHDADTGRVYVYAGRTDTQNLTPTLILDGEQPGDGFGVDVAGAGDVNGDGYADLLVGAWQNDEAGSNAGQVYLYLGSAAGLTSTNVITLTGPPDSQFGTAVAGVGDVNGDGYADILVGADVADSEAVIAGVDVITDTGRAYLYLGSPTGPVSPPALVLTGENQDDRFGFAAAGGGDLNGDGFGDLAVGAKDFDRSADPLDADAGKAYAYGGCLGGPQATAIFSATGETGFDSYGRSLAIAGDLNGDNVDDLVVGAFAAEFIGRFYVYYGVDQGGCRASITLTKTVALAQEPRVCGTSSAITITQGQSVDYCYQVRNTGNITLTHHFVTDAADDEPTILARTSFTLTPGATYTHTISYTPTVSITHSATWTAIVTVTGPGGIDALDPDTIITATASAQTSVVVTVPVDQPTLRLPALLYQPQP